MEDRYQKKARLGEGGAGQVWLVEDRRRSGHLLALKELASRDGDQAEALRNEFATLALLRHPNLVEVDELDRDPTTDLPRFTLEHVEGTSFVETVRLEGPDALFGLTVEALRALAFLHDFGIAHRDLKPDNLLVRKAPRLDARLVVLDFGLAAESFEPKHAGAAGTLAYAAPELLEGGAADNRSDLYALGSVVFEAIHGTTPVRIQDRDMGKVIEAIREGRRRRPEIPEGFHPGWSRWIEALLARDAKDRPGTASEALALLNDCSDSDAELESHSTRAARLASGPPPGRVAETHTLWTAVEASAEKPDVVWLSGHAGTGKTRHMRWLASHAIRHGYDVVLHRDSVLTSETSSSEELVADYLADLRRRAREGPTLLLVDDVESASRATHRLLARVALEASEAPVRVVAAVREAELDAPSLRALIDSRVELGPLDSDGLRAMADRIGGAISPTRLKALERHSAGNPLVAETLLVDGDIERAAAKLDPEAPLRSSVEARLGRVSNETRAWLTALAVLGDDAAAEQITAVSELEESVARASAAESLTAGMIRERDGLVRCNSKLVRELLLDKLEADDRAALYHRAIALLEADDRTDHSWRLAHVHRDAGNNEEAARYAIAAATASKKQKDFAEAARRLYFALCLLPYRHRRRRELRLKQGDLYLLADEYSAAARATGSALRLSGSDEERAEAMVQLANAKALMFKLDQAETLSEQALHFLDQGDINAGRAAYVLGVVFGRRGLTDQAVRSFDRAIQVFDTHQAWRFLGEALQGLCAASDRDDPVKGCEYATGAFEVFERLGLRSRRLKSLFSIARIQGRLNQFESAREILRNLVVEATRFGDRWLLTLARGLLTEFAMASGQLDEALRLSIAIEADAMASAEWDRVANIQGLRIEVFLELGRFEEARQTFASIMALPQDRIESNSLGYARLDLFFCLLDSPETDAQELGRLVAEALERLGTADDRRGILMAWIARLTLHVRERDFAACEETAAEFKKIDGADSDKIHEIVFRRGLAQAAVLEAKGSLQDALVPIEETLERSRLDGQSLHVMRALAIKSRVLVRAGDNESARAAQNEGKQLLDELCEKIEDPQVRQDLRAHPLYRQLLAEPEEDEAMLQRLKTLYEMIRTLNSEQDPDALLESILEMALKAVDAERGMILLRDPRSGDFSVRLSRNLEDETAKDAETFSRTVVGQAGEGQSILTLDAESDERFKEMKSVSLYHIHSLMCVPLRSRGEIIGTVYLDSRRQGKLFDQQDLEFLESFADQAALALENARTRARLEEENRRLLADAKERVRFDRIIGRCEPMQKVFDLIEKIAQSDLPVLIHGESGTGKELVARAIHFHGPRKEMIFLTENCAALPETLLESELFGHVKGAFTGAERDRAGLFEQADGGSLFLDEVGDMSAGMQARLLRVLQEGKLRRVGGNETLQVDVRVIAATHRDLERHVKQGSFREDLLYRLQVLSVALPPLRARFGDVPLLIAHLMGRISEGRGRPAPEVRDEVMSILEGYHWPGNVRELENALQRLALLAGDGPITRRLIESDDGLNRRLLGVSAATTPVLSMKKSERDQIKRALELCDGNKNKAAKLLGISRATIYRRIRELEL